MKSTVFKGRLIPLSRIPMLLPLIWKSELARKKQRSNRQSFMMQDPELTGAIEGVIKSENVNTEVAVEMYVIVADVFASMDDELMQQRATDLRDLKTKIQKILMGIQKLMFLVWQPEVYCCRRLDTSITAGITSDNVTGIVTELVVRLLILLFWHEH